MSHINLFPRQFALFPRQFAQNANLSTGLVHRENHRYYNTYKYICTCHVHVCDMYMYMYIPSSFNFKILKLQY